MPVPSPEIGQAGRNASRQRLIDAGELVSNAPFRERVEFLMAHDPEFSLNMVCERLCDQGLQFEQRRAGRTRNKFQGDTTHLLRLLGMRDQTTSTKKTKKGPRRYTPPARTQFIAYDVAVALCRALEMWPCDCGV